MPIPMTTLSIDVALHQRLAAMAAHYNMVVDHLAWDLLLAAVEAYEAAAQPSSDPDDLWRGFQAFMGAALQHNFTPDVH